MKLKQITLKQARERKLKKLGSGVGANLEHCLYLASKYCKDFDKARYYVIISKVTSLEKGKERKKLINEGSFVEIEVY